MRPVLIGDVTEAARALLAVPPAARATLARALVAEAEAADICRRRTGRLPSSGGDGTLMTAARAHPQAPLTRIGAQEVAVLTLILSALCPDPLAAPLIMAPEAYFP